MIKVAIADARAVVRMGVRSILERISDFEVIGEAVDGVGAMALSGLSEPRVLTFGLAMPGVHGIELITQIECESPFVRVLVLTMHPEETHAVQALWASASGFLAKACLGEDLVEAIRKVASGGVYISLAVGWLLVLGIVKLPRARRHDGRCDDYQKAVDGFWASSTNSRHATNRAASCLR